MKMISRPITVIVPLLLALLALTPIRRAALAQAPHSLLVVVGNKTDLSNISLATLRKAFQGRPAEYASGKRLIPFNLEVDTPERRRFDRKVLGLSPDQVGRFWITTRIRDEGFPPRNLPSRSFGLRVVATLAGAITYVDAETSTAGVRVLTIDGKSPGDQGYPLTY